MQRIKLVKNDEPKFALILLYFTSLELYPVYSDLTQNPGYLLDVTRY